jgi:hypothetical protein
MVNTYLHFLQRGGTPCTVKIIHQAQEIFRHLMIFGNSVRSRLNSLIWSAGVRRNAQTHWRERRGYAQGIGARRRAVQGNAGCIAVSVSPLSPLVTGSIYHTRDRQWLASILGTTYGTIRLPI